MDLLGSIMGSMTAPPSLSEKEKEKRKKMKEMEDKQRKATKLFREETEKKINEFIKVRLFINFIFYFSSVSIIKLQCWL